MCFCQRSRTRHRIEAGRIPIIDHRDQPFVIDFIPIDHLALIIIVYSLSRRRDRLLRPYEPTCHFPYRQPFDHPVPLHGLSGLVKEFRHGDVFGDSLTSSLYDWLHSELLPVTEDDPSDDARQLPRNTPRIYPTNGHAMFALNASGTKATMGKPTMGDGAEQSVANEFPESPSIGTFCGGCGSGLGNTLGQYFQDTGEMGVSLWCRCASFFKLVSALDKLA